MKRQLPIKKILGLALVLAASVALLNVTGRPLDGPSFWGLLLHKLTSPIARGAEGIKARFAMVGAAFQDKAELLEEIAELRDQLRSMPSLLASLKEYEAENERLKGLLGIEDAWASDYEAAKVFGRDPSKWFSTVSISKGSAHGIDKDAAVVSPAGLVGRVLALGDDSSIVLLITDPESGVGAIVERTRDLGIVLGGGGSDQLTARFFRRDADVVEGDLIVTSGMGSLFPGGILIGEVVEVNIPQPGLVKEAVVRPFVDLEHLEEVLVIKK